MMYHGTEHYRRVLKEGLYPNKRRNYRASRDGYVYLAFTRDYAYNFAGPQGRVLAVDVPESEVIRDPDSPAGMIKTRRIHPKHIELAYESKAAEETDQDWEGAAVVSEDDALPEIPAEETRVLGTHMEEVDNSPWDWGARDV